MSKPIVIVESPSKCPCIRKHTDNQYDASATVGHVKDLPADSLAIPEDANGHIDFKAIKFVPLPAKTKLIKEIKTKTTGRDVFLATDPDREGESIAYDIYGEIKRTAKTICRIDIRQITSKGIRDAIASPRQINQLTVDAQRCRRFIDRLVGYKLTKYAAAALGTKMWAEASVGRTQAAALKMVYDRDKEIENFQPEPYWTISLTDKTGVTFSSRVFKDKNEADAVLAYFKKNGAAVQKVDRVQQSEGSPQPLTAASLQQKSTKIFGYSPTKTMNIAQGLYQAGLITYMRTDSVRLAPETQAEANAYLKDCFKDIAPARPPVHMNKGGNTQDAHEAIHPTEINQKGDPKNLPANMSVEDKNIYTLIWNYFYASQSKPALWDTCKVSVASSGCKEVLTASGKSIVDPGWHKFLGGAEAAQKQTDRADNEDNPPQNTKAITSYREGGAVGGSIGTKQNYTKPPAYYTMETFMKALEKNGIGRPATWATLSSTILERNYVNEDKKQIKHTPKGDAMVQWLVEVCPQIVNVEFTAQMENDLEAIEAGKARKEDIVNRLNDVLHHSIDKAKLIPYGKFHFDGVDYSNKSKDYYPRKSGSSAPSSKSGTSKSGYSKSGYGKSYSKPSAGSKAGAARPSYNKPKSYGGMER